MTELTQANDAENERELNTIWPVAAGSVTL